jgi:hypothetical protein
MLLSSEKPTKQKNSTTSARKSLKPTTPKSFRTTSTTSQTNCPQPPGLTEHSIRLNVTYEINLAVLSFKPDINAVGSAIPTE